MVRYLDIMGVVFLVYGLWQIATAAAVVALLMAISLGMISFGIAENELALSIAGGFYGGIGILAGVFQLLWSMPAVFAGIGIQRRRQWGRIMGFVASALALWSLPIGTTVGVFGFVVLLDKSVTEEFERAQREEEEWD